ncbi:uncharacterized protein BDV14DRAFT_34722 [Aspergillus stella-maris]|uniref:uncharacterized protein n=1 Tax=Aspergillus stella-maris TaxID=1810926 RepID=UPI003CCE20A6
MKFSTIITPLALLVSSASAIMIEIQPHVGSGGIYPHFAGLNECTDFDGASVFRRFSSGPAERYHCTLYSQWACAGNPVATFYSDSTVAHTEMFSVFCALG